MAHFKESSPNSNNILSKEFVPLFEDFDENIDGGLVLLPNGQIAEVIHNSWDLYGQNDLSKRMTVLPFEYSNGSFKWLNENNWGDILTVGSELEGNVINQDTGEPHKVFPFGTYLDFPNGLMLSDHNYTCEALKYTMEMSLPVGNGFEDYREKAIVEHYNMENILSNNNAMMTGESVYPNIVTNDDLTDHPYVKLMDDKMPSLKEFATLSEQFHIQLKGIEEGLYALSWYQPYQSLIGILTESSPLRDSKFNTTIDEHFLINKELPELNDLIDEHDIIRTYGNVSPHDWRELSRYFGSPSAGTYKTAAPKNINDWLQMSDKLLRKGEIVSSLRTLGWHTDRLRWDIGTLEICNPGRSGGNLHKSFATQSLIAGLFIALQNVYQTDDISHPLLTKYDTLEDRQFASEIGHINNIYSGLNGKDTSLITIKGEVITPIELLDRMLDFINKFAPKQYPNNEDIDELKSTLSNIDEDIDFNTAEDVAEYFYSKNSKLTANEAYRLSAEIDTEKTTSDILAIFAIARRNQVITMYENMKNDN